MKDALISRNELKKRIQLAPDKGNETWTELYDSVMHEIDTAKPIVIVEDMPIDGSYPVPLIVRDIVIEQHDEGKIDAEGLCRALTSRICHFCPGFDNGDFTKECVLCKMSTIFQTIDLFKLRKD